MKITPEDIVKLNEAYLLCGTYVGAAKVVGCAASTAKKYIDPNFKSVSAPANDEIVLPPLEDVYQPTNAPFVIVGTTALRFV